MSGWGLWWAHKWTEAFETPLQMLVALRVGDNSPLGPDHSATTDGSLVGLAESCRCSVAEVAVALREVAYLTDCDLQIKGNEYLLYVPEADVRSAPSLKSDVERARSRFGKKRKRFKYLLEEPCRACGAPAEHLDHIIPLARGGTNDGDNLQPLCASCNYSKGTKTMVEFLAWRSDAGGEA